MARTVLTVQEISRTGLNITYVAGDQANGHSFANIRHNVFLHVKNSNAATRDVTITTPNTVDCLAIGDLVVTVPANTGDVMIGPFPGSLYDTIDTDPDPDIDPAIFVSLSADAGITLAAVRLPGPSY